MKTFPIVLFRPRQPRTTKIAAAGLSGVIVPTAIYAISETGRWVDGHMKSACEKAARKSADALAREAEGQQAQPVDSLAKARRACRSCLRSFAPVAASIACTAGTLILLKSADAAVDAVRRAEKKALREMRRRARPYPFNRLPV